MLIYKKTNSFLKAQILITECLDSFFDDFSYLFRILVLYSNRLTYLQCTLVVAQNWGGNEEMRSRSILIDDSSSGISLTLLSWHNNTTTTTTVHCAHCVIQFSSHQVATTQPRYTCGVVIQTLVETHPFLYCSLVKAVQGIALQLQSGDEWVEFAQILRVYCHIMKLYHFMSF